MRMTMGIGMPSSSNNSERMVFSCVDQTISICVLAQTISMLAGFVCTLTHCVLMPGLPGRIVRSDSRNSGVAGNIHKRGNMTPISYLYVEDNADLREMVCVLIAHDGRTITSVANAEEALDIQSTQTFDVLLSDVSLPGMSGIDLAKRWLAADRSRWVVLFSGYDIGQNAARLGPNVRAVQKNSDPAQLDALLAEVDNAVRQKSGQFMTT